MRSTVSNKEGVQHIEVEGTGKTTLTYDPSKISLEEVKKVIIDLGYEIRSEEK
ncbi:heavy-metal-associated domain-containing protein [Niallia circulans]|nr:MULTISPECIES: heavy-metal-associated domain-containing protein [unclassified Bacillus (in: firmicutes)]MCF2647251.1 heavy-metal-associated domain-containing protein [Niallia circulans]